MVSSWQRNGVRYWRLQTEDAEVVASTDATYTPHHPPAHAKFEVYSVKKGMSTFLGYALGDHAARLYACFCRAFSR